MEYVERVSFIEIFWSLVNLAHLINFTIIDFFISTQHLNTVDGNGFGVCFQMGKK